MLERSSARYVTVLWIVDMLGTMGALLLARALRIALQYGRLLNPGGVALHWPMFLMLVVIWSLTFVTFRVYDPHRFAHTAEEVQSTLPALVVATLVFAGALYFTYRGLSRLLYVYFFLIDLILLSLNRWVLRRAIGNHRRQTTRGVLIVGAGAVGQQVSGLLRPWEWTGIRVVGYLDDDEAKVGDAYDGVGVLGTLSDAPAVVEEHGIQEVVIALPMDAHRQLANVVTRLEALPVNIKVVPDYSEIVFYRTTVEELGGTLFIGIKEPVIGPIDRSAKRVFDILVSTMLLILLAPLLATISLLVVVTSRGPVFYKSRRIGEGGRPFDMLKFRTMQEHADQTEAELISETTDGKLIFDKRQDDPRITRLGRLLRRYSLDELPQLYNVLIGDMSLVGPRPELPALVERYDSWQRKRFGVPQGMTGWWQVSGRGAKAKYLHVEDDLYYIRNYSLFLDVRILWRTAGAVIRGEGAF